MREVFTVQPVHQTLRVNLATATETRPWALSRTLELCPQESFPKAQGFLWWSFGVGGLHAEGCPGTRDTGKSPGATLGKRCIKPQGKVAGLYLQTRCP